MYTPKAQWSLYVPPGLTFTNSMFCPHSVFMCFVWISEQTAIISLYNINWLVSTTEAECVHSAVRTKSLKTNSETWLRPSFAGLSPPRPRFDACACKICGWQSSTGTDFSPNTSVFPCQYHSTNVRYFPSPTPCFTRMTNGRRLGTFQKKNALSDFRGHWTDMHFHLLRLYRVKSSATKLAQKVMLISFHVPLNQHYHIIYHTRLCFMCNVYRE
jgi:hypothetical protein